MRNFVEITAQFENTNGVFDEIMIHINQKGRIIRAYCWADGIPQIEKYNERKGEYYVSACKIKKCQNSLFLDISLDWLIKNLGWMYISIDEESEINLGTPLSNAILNYKELTVDLN
jgi:uncharacterized protein YuzE